jgi:hypothetical protein
VAKDCYAAELRLFCQFIHLSSSFFSGLLSRTWLLYGELYEFGRMFGRFRGWAQRRSSPFFFLASFSYRVFFKQLITWNILLLLSVVSMLSYLIPSISFCLSLSSQTKHTYLANPLY